MSVQTQDAHPFLHDQCSIIQNAESMSEPADEGDQVSWHKLHYSIDVPLSNARADLERHQLKLSGLR